MGDLGGPDFILQAGLLAAVGVLMSYVLACVCLLALALVARLALGPQADEDDDDDDLDDWDDAASRRLGVAVGAMLLFGIGGTMVAMGGPPMLIPALASASTTGSIIGLVASRIPPMPGLSVGPVIVLTFAVAVISAMIAAALVPAVEAAAAPALLMAWQ